MSYDIHSGGPLSPRRWFLSSDGVVLPVWRCFLFLVVAFLLLGLLRGALRGAGLDSFHPLATITGSLAGSGTLLVIAWFLLSVLDRRSFRTLGLWFYSGWPRESLLGAAFGAALMLAVALLFLASQVASFSVPAHNWESVGGIAFLAVVLLFAAAFEEILFRGYAFQRLVDAAGAAAATAIFSALFGLAHLANEGATPLSTGNVALAGALLSVAYLKTRALWFPIGLHWAWNFTLGPLLGFPVSGFLLPASLLEVTTTAPTWWSGGAFGPEGSLGVTALLAGATTWLARTPHFAPSPAMREVLE